jgi:hypothetical protein
MVLCWRGSSRWDIVLVLVLVLVLDPIGNALHQPYLFDYENDDEDEKQSNRHFRRLPLKSLLSNCLEEDIFSERSLGRSIVPYGPWIAFGMRIYEQSVSFVRPNPKFRAKLAIIWGNEHF